MSRPVLLAVDDDRGALEGVETQLAQRYSHEYRVESCGDPEDALRTLQELADAGEDVALVLASSSLSSTSGGHLLEHVRRLYPQAGRVLLVPAFFWRDEPTSHSIRDAMALGSIDYYAPRPAGPFDEVFHEAISGFLLEWAQLRRVVPQTVHIVGETWSGRAYEMREVFEQCAAPHSFCLAGSAQGRELIAGAGPEVKLPLMVLPDGKALSDPTDAEIAELIGAPAGLEERDYDVVIVGSGPAGLSAAVYGASEGLRILVVDERRHRRPGAVELADPQLPGLRHGRQRQPPRRAGPPAGGRVRRELPVHASSDRSRSPPETGSACRSRTGGASARGR